MGQPDRIRKLRERLAVSWKGNNLHKLQLRKLWLLPGAGLLSVVLLLAMVMGSDNSAADSPYETITIIAPSTEEEAETEVENMELTRQVTALVIRYLNALADCDIDTLDSICETTQAFDKEALEQQASYIEGYQNVDCVIMNGLVSNTYVVYVYYEMKVHYIDTPAPALVQLLVKIDNDGLPYIYQGVIDGELSAYMAELTNSEPITQMADEVNRKLEEACQSDEALDAFIQVLKGERIPKETAEWESETENFH